MKTPMLRQYYNLKQQFPGTILFFRLGDFYELFFDDAVMGARELGITLTARHKEHGQPIPMCGVPHHAAASHVARLVRKGFRVAICEQTENPAQPKKLLRREVVRIITPGTAIDPQLVEARESIYLAAVCGAGERMAASFLDLSTGEFRATEIKGAQAWERIRADLESYAPREILFPASLAPFIQSDANKSREGSLPLPDDTRSRAHDPSDSQTEDADSAFQNEAVLSSAALTPQDDWLWQTETCASLLLEHFGVSTLESFGLEGKTEAIRAAGVCLRYAQEMQRAAAAHITDLVFFESHDHLILDSVTVRNLELIESQGAEPKSRALINVLDETVTGMGARLLRSWLLHPSLKRGEIEARQDAVAELHASQITRDRVRSLLKEVADLERLTARLNMNTASPRDLVALARSLDQAPQIRRALNEARSSLLQILYESTDECADLRALITQAIGDDPPAKLSDCGVIRDGFSTELDELRSISCSAKQTIATLEARERARSGISSLRIRYNNVFGYYIEISKANLARVPLEYERKQTLSNAERFTTPELREWEHRVTGADERIAQLETELFQDLCLRIARETRRIQATARALSTLDALSSLAETAVRRRYVRPLVHEGDEIEIAQGRHPTIEAFGSQPFIPNDLYMNNSTDRLLIITGPNMGGKSTILRQTAIISILAQMGSFVPAERARLPLLDRIWTRVGASDDLSRGRSTFMVEMTETAQILRNASPRSLVLLDEIGRGTSTFDGLSLAWAVAEYLHDSPEHAAKTLFATHYHELTELAERLPGAQNYQITAAERDGTVVFLHKLERGRASKSYGIEVARLAGLPPAVLERAREVLERLEHYELDVFADEDEKKLKTKQQSADKWESWAADGERGLDKAARRVSRKRAAEQATLFDAINLTLLDELRQLELDSLSPEEAKKLLANLRKRIV